MIREDEVEKTTTEVSMDVFICPGRLGILSKVTPYPDSYLSRCSGNRIVKQIMEFLHRCIQLTVS
jgi:hypothetical protein